MDRDRAWQWIDDALWSSELAECFQRKEGFQGTEDRRHGEYRILNRTTSAFHGVLIEVIRNRCFEKGIKPQGYPGRCHSQSTQLSPEEVDRVSGICVTYKKFLK